jgi:hypothetical protein
LSVTWSERLTWWSATLAAALVMTYMAVVAWTDVGSVAVVRAGLPGMAAAALLCGALLGLACRRALVACIVAAGVATLAFGLVWSLVAWALVGRLFESFLELAASDMVSLFLLPRAGITLALTAGLSLAAAAAMTALVPERLRA